MTISDKKTKELFIRGGRVIDPSCGRDEEADVYIRGGYVEEAPSRAPDGCRVINARNLWVSPGLIDVHVHFREPGQEYKETIETGLNAAAAGGFTAVVCMPNTQPPMDNAQLVSRVLSMRCSNSPELYSSCALTKGRKGKKLVDMAACRDAGAVVFTDDGSGLESDELMGKAFQSCASLGSIIAQHCEYHEMSAGGVVNKGRYSQEMGVPGWPADAEISMLRRDCSLLEGSGARYHAQHLSCAGSVDVVRNAKQKGLEISAEVTPHHLLFTEDDVMKLGSRAKVNPPLRTKKDRDELREALAAGIIDIVATDHAPHSVEEKSSDLNDAPFGIAGLETAVPVILKLVHDGIFSPIRMIEFMSTAPAKLFDLPGGSIMPGQVANVTIIDPQRSFNVDDTTFRTKDRNSPYRGMKMPGKAVMTIVGGRVIHEEEGIDV